jgi:hypothetical protein
MDNKTHKLFVKILLYVACMLIVTACATAPVQEMSDARQAIQVAKSVGVDEHSQSNLVQAKKFLKKAEQALHIGKYKKARVNALAAKEEAFQAQQFANLTRF